MLQTLDFAWLTDEQLAAASPLIGGSSAMIMRCNPASGLGPVEITWLELSTVIVNWGDPSINQILEIINDYKSYDDYCLALVLNEYVWVGKLIAKVGNYYDRETDEFRVMRFDPREYHGRSYVVPWKAKEEAATMMRIWSEQQLGVPAYVDINDDYYMQWQMGTSLESKEKK